MKQFPAFLFSIITFASCAQGNSIKPSNDHLAANKLKNYSVATFAAGCFWHEEALFESVKGVKEAVSGMQVVQHQILLTKMLKQAKPVMQNQ
jgi:peptide-methionine (S)-S-oxide reductase